MRKLISGKVRDVFLVNQKQLVIVTTDRISAFDVIMDTSIPEKGKVLNSLTKFWFDYTKDIVSNHMISCEMKDMPEQFHKPEFSERIMLVKKLKMIPFEFVVRGYIFGNLWKEYQKNDVIWGHKLPENLHQGERLETPILTPSTKTSNGHDKYVDCQFVENSMGEELFRQIESICFELYSRAYQYAYKRNIIIADAKFEFGIDEQNNLVLADEIFTPDSSRFWNVNEYKVGESPKSFDKEFIREWLMKHMDEGKIRHNIPNDVVKKTALIYQECKNILLDKIDNDSI